MSEESEGHTHGENCFAKGGELICGQDDLTFLVSSEAGTTLLDSDYASLAAAFQAIFDSEEKSGTIVITKDHTPEAKPTKPMSAFGRAKMAAGIPAICGQLWCNPIKS